MVNIDRAMLSNNYLLFYYFYFRGEEIKKSVTARKEGTGPWILEKHRFIQTIEVGKSSETEQAQSSLHVEASRQSETEHAQSSLHVEAGKQSDTEQAQCSLPVEASKQSDTEQAQSQTELNDPDLYSGRRLMTCDINVCLKAGPCHPNRNYPFPVTNNRRLSPDWFTSILSDGSKRTRLWLSYSKSREKGNTYHDNTVIIHIMITMLS